MRASSWLRVAILSVVAVIMFAATAAAKAPKADKPLKILFIGNSYTSVNNLPALVTALAEAGGRKIEAVTLLKGGATLERHIKESAAADKIGSQPWDIVVLQEQSLRPIHDADAMYQSARTLHAAIEKRGAKTLFYLTWARQDKPQTQDALNRSYFTIAKELNADVAPVGLAWRAALAAEPSLALHTSDKSHPTAEGSYLAACVFYGTLFDKSPEGLPAELRKGEKSLVKLDAGVAGRLQKTAWKVVREVKDKPAKAKWAWE